MVSPIPAKEREIAERIRAEGYECVYGYITENFVPSAIGDYSVPFDNAGIEIRLKLAPFRESRPRHFEHYEPAAGTPEFYAAECYRLMESATSEWNAATLGTGRGRLQFPAEAMKNLERAALRDGRDGGTDDLIAHLPQRLKRVHDLRVYALTKNPTLYDDQFADVKLYDWLRKNAAENMKPSYSLESWCKYSRDLRKRFGGGNPRHGRPHGKSIVCSTEI